MSTLTGDSDTLDLVRIVFEFGEAPPLDGSLCTTLIERHNVRKVRDVIYSLQGGGVHKVDSLVLNSRPTVQYRRFRPTSLVP